MKSSKTYLRAGILLGAACALCACGGSGAGSGQMSLSVADAPVDGATAVVVKFTGVELLQSDGTPVDINFSQPKSIDLLNQSNTASAQLFNQPIPAGSYSSIRLLVVADGNPSNSYIVLQGSSGPTGLTIPSGAQTGLKLVSGFNVSTSGVVDYTIDFDLRKSITCPNGQSSCFLQPALRLVDNSNVGNIQGTVSNALFTGTLTAPCVAPAVYLFSGANVTAQGYNATGPNPPLTSKAPALDTATNSYYYQFTFLPPGSYTVAYTCDADLDTSSQASTMVFNPVVTNVSVVATQTTTVDIQ
ncbi:MAG: DUF4382 domain-containing protein [Gammaproteobacteria bacterium]|nr:DUF4382 domain-containing protein [Gammaproteobacteria bacterium]